MPRVLILSTSLNPNSRSGRLAERALAAIQERRPDVPAEVVDLREAGTLPLPGTPGAWGAHEVLDALRAKLREATHVLFAVPIYNFSASGTAKTLVELLT